MNKRQKEELRRAQQLDRNMSKSGKRIHKILRRSQRAVRGAIIEFTEIKNFMTNAAVRNQLYAELGREYRALNSNVNEWVNSEVNVTAKNFWDYAKEDLPKGAVPGTFGAFSEKYVGDIVGTINPSTVNSQVAMNAQIGGMLTQDIRALRAAVSTTMAEGAVEGLTNPQLADRMRAKVTKTTGQFSFIDKAGRRWKADNYFAMLNRTLHASTARQSYITTATTEAGFDLYQIEGGVTGSSVEHPGDPCDNWAGKIISMTGATKGYPTYQDALDDGVFHPNCVHFIRAILPSEIETAKKEQAQEKKTATELGE